MSQAQHISVCIEQTKISSVLIVLLQTACSYGSSLSGFDLWLVVGEWSPAATDCAKYLNGRGIGARYDGSYSGSPKVGSCTGLTGAASSFSSSYKTFLRQYWEAQVIAFERGAQGWIQWDWKNENADEWSYQVNIPNSSWKVLL